jgi:hypothetical protein
MIVPTIGRKVWFWPVGTKNIADSTQPLDATVVYVHGPHLVNLACHDQNGQPFPAAHIPLRQPGEEAPAGPYCEWMPYQVGAATSVPTTAPVPERIVAARPDLKVVDDAPSPTL